jgi:hypothetical protein
VYVAGGDTTTQPGRFTAFQARIKGETEIELADICKSNPAMKGCSVRPFAVDVEGHDAIKPYVGPRPLVHRVAGYVLAPAIRRYGKDYWAPTGALGEFLTELAMGQHEDALRDDKGLNVEMLGEFPLWSNSAMRKIKGY